MIAFAAIQTAAVLVIAFYCLREWRNATRYRREALTVQGDRLDVELVRWARDRGKLVVTSLNPEGNEERERDGDIAEFAHALQDRGRVG